MRFVSMGAVHSYCTHCGPRCGAVPNASCACQRDDGGVAPLLRDARRVSAETNDALGVATMAALSGCAGVALSAAPARVAQAVPPATVRNSRLEKPSSCA